MFDPPIFRAGGHQISAGALNRIAEEVARQSGTANTISGIEGVHDLPPGPDATLARIVGRGGVSGGLPVPYTWLAVTPTNTDGTTPLYADNPAFGFGTVAINPAYEASGQRDVPTDGSVVVALTPAGDGSHFTFPAPAEDLVPLKITADLGGGKYSAVEEEGATGGAYGDLPGGVSTSLLYEENDTAGIAAGTVVYARRGYGSGYPHVLVWVSQFGDDAALHNVQSVRIRGATGGSFTLTYDDDTTGAAPNPQTTGAIAWNVSAAALKAALEALSNVTTVNVTGAGTDASPYLVELVDDFASHQLLVPDYSALTGRQEWVFDGSGLVKLSVGEQDGSPTYPNIKLLQFHQDNGFVVTLPAAGTALVSQTAASAATVGYVTTARQRIGGQKDLDLLCVGLGSTVDLSAGGQPTVAVGDSLGNLTRIFGNVIEQFDNTLTHSTVIALTANGLELSGDGTAIYVGRDYLLGGHGFHVVVWGDSSFNGYPSLNLFNSFAGTMAHGGTATTGGLSFIGGLYTGGSLVAGTITVGTTAISGGTVGDLLTIGAGPVVSSASLSSLLDGLGGVTGAF